MRIPTRQMNKTTPATAIPAIAPRGSPLRATARGMGTAAPALAASVEVGVADADDGMELDWKEEVDEEDDGIDVASAILTSSSGTSVAW
jgi:hypothetical protein